MLVSGATGYLGGFAARELEAQGIFIRLGLDAGGLRRRTRIGHAPMISDPSIRARFSIPMATICFCLLVCPPASGAPSGSAAIADLSADQTVSGAQIVAGRRAAESDTALDEDQKSKILKLYDQAGRSLQQAQETRARLSRLEAKVREAPLRIEAIRSGQAKPDREMPAIDPVLAAGKAEQIELALTREQLALDQAREAEKKLSDERARLLVGSEALSEEIASRIEALEQIDADSRAPTEEEPSMLLQARTLASKARRMLRQAELELFKLRLGSHDLLTNLAQAEHDFTRTEIAERQTRVDVLGQTAQALREARAREARRQAEAEARKSKTESLPHVLQTIAEENARFRLELEELIKREQSVSGDLRAARLRLDEIKSDFERTRQRVNVLGTTPAMGRLLERRRDELPSLQTYRRTTAERRAENDRATDRQIEIDELLRERGPVPAVVARALESLPESERLGHEAQALELARNRREALNELQKVYGRYLGQIASLGLAERQLVEQAGAYVDYIDSQLLWLPGPGIPDLFGPEKLGESLRWLFAADHWAEVAHDARDLARQRPLWTLSIGLGFLLLLGKRRRAAARIREIARDVGMIRTDSFVLTLKALAFTLVVIGAWPLLLTGSGWLLGTFPAATSFTLSVAQGLALAGASLAIMRFLRQICLEDGVGQRHLRWPQRACDALVRELGWILPPAVPLAFLVAATSGYQPLPVTQPLGQLAFILLSMLIAVFVYRLARRRGPAMEALSETDGPLVRLHFLWFPLMLLLPLGLAATSALGYHYAAWHLDLRSEQTISFFVGLFLLKELVLRSLYVAERRLRLEEAVRRRDELRSQRAKTGDLKKEDSSPISLDIPEVNFDELSEQTKRLVHAAFVFVAVIGIWGIWSDLWPALSFVNSMELPFHATRIVDGLAKEVPVTLGDLAVGLLVVVITVLAAKNIPGVLEIALLKRLPLDPGARYAITSLSRYAIAGIGVIVAFSTLGLQWSNIQWLVAALGVGLGFGLQEIVANFISGIILLFERPIRVGDVVTIDDTTGVVSRIRIRATTITNYDKQELLIPNKEFITGRVVNWTLSDMTNRVLVTVGAAYGTDVAKAMALMLEAAAENENILEEPKPVVTFEAFGDNALTLVLRSYLGSMDDRLTTITALHQAIYDKLNEAGVDIAFPQRDVHLDTDKPLDIHLHKVTSAASPEERG